MLEKPIPIEKKSQFRPFFVLRECRLIDDSSAWDRCLIWPFGRGAAMSSGAYGVHELELDDEGNEVEIGKHETWTRRVANIDRESWRG